MTDIETRRVEVDDLGHAAPKSGTGPLDFFIPWVVELRVMGTTQVLQVQVNEILVLGRSSEGEVVRPEIDLSPFNAHYLGVSRQHAMLTARNSRVTILDLGSTNGTYINGGRLRPQQEYRLRHGDQLTLGKLMLQVSFVLVPSSSETTDSAYINITIPQIGAGRKVMLVEDDERIAQTISYVLEHAGFVVESVSTVASAIPLLEQDPPAVVSTELMLPDHSGLELVHYLRSRENAPYIPVIVMTSVTGGYQKTQALDAGVDVFLSKPVGVDQIMRGFQQVLEQPGV